MGGISPSCEMHLESRHIRAHRVSHRWVTFALQWAVQELGPEAAKLHAKHWAAAQQGHMKAGNDGVLQSLEQVIRRLSDS
jgi:hypothetical protein